MNKTSRILITGAHGFVGTNLVRFFHKSNTPFDTLIVPGREDCPLGDFHTTMDFFVSMKPDYVFHLAGRVAGIGGNENHQHEAFFENSLINMNVITACMRVGVKKIVAMGSGCIYSPDLVPPYQEKDIWTGKPHASEYGYAQAKRSMLAQLECSGLNYAYVVSSNLYGEYDHFNLDKGHVIPSLIKKFYENEKPIAWGNGSAQRDFMHVMDAARALTLIMDNIDGPVNMGSGQVNTIADVVSILEKNTGKKAEWDETKPNGQAYRAYNLDQLKTIDFGCEYNLERGLKETYDWYADHHESARV